MSAVATGVSSVRVSRRSPWERAAPALAAGLFAAVYGAISLTRFARWETPSWDNAIFEQAVAGYAHLRAPIVDIKAPGFNQLGDHFSPILALLGPVYRVFPYAQTLLVAQAVLVGLSVLPIGRAALRMLGTGRGLAVTVAYGLSFGVQAAISADFHEVAFAAPLLAFAGEAGLRGRWRSAACWCLPLLLVKEDLGLTVAAIGVVAALAGARRVGWLLAAAGVVGAAMTVLVIIPAFNRSGSFDYWSLVGGGGGPSLWHNFFAAGWQFKAGALAATFGITGFVALRSPWALATIPTLAWRFAGDRATFWGVEWQYSLVLMPIVFIAALDGQARIRARESASTSTGVGASPVTGPSARSDAGPGRWLRFAARAAPKLPAAMLAGALVACLWLPTRGLVDGAAYRPNPRVAAAAAVIALMPPGASVETNRGPITHLTSRYRVYWFDSIGGAVIPDFVLSDTHTDTHTDFDGDLVAFAQQQHPGATYRLIYDHDGYQLAQRTGE